MLDSLIKSNIGSLAVYKPGKPIEEVQRELGLERVIKLASNENPLGPSPRAVEAVSRAIGEVHRYPDGSAYRLKRALAAALDVEPEAVLLANGSNEVVQQLSLAVLDEGDEAVMPVPSFPRYEPLARLMKAEPVEVPLTDYRLDLEAMATRISPRTKIVYICNPNNPTGTIVRKDEFETFLDKLPPRVLVVMDEAYFEYVDDPLYPDGLDYFRRGRNVIVLRTFSKIYGLAGLRVGYAIGSPDLIAYLERVREPFNVNALAQTAALAALGDREFVRRSQDLAREGKRFLYSAFTSRGISYVPSEANFIFFDAGRPEQEVFRRMLRRGVIVRGGFGYPTMLRVTIGTPDENAVFIEAFDGTLREDF
ncbi:histidinol-phosphate transaminase [Desulforudis sp. 1088]|uniref:histidinol-phosphate transaminase n=1 Tax=unclassified Candidatus Desulforudis TaxID=2635950 RepID=UPI003CE4E529